MSMPPKFQTIAPPVATLTPPRGLQRATSARKSPFQPTDDAPNARKNTAIKDAGHPGVRKAVAPQQVVVTSARNLSNARLFPARSAIHPHRIRPPTPAACTKESSTPAATRL